MFDLAAIVFFKSLRSTHETIILPKMEFKLEVTPFINKNIIIDLKTNLDVSLLTYVPYPNHDLVVMLLTLMDKYPTLHLRLPIPILASSHYETP
jgi:hypothetical protein